MSCDEAIELARIVDDRPCEAFYQASKGTGLVRAGDHAAARAAYEEALAILRSLAQAQPQVYRPDVATTLEGDWLAL